MTTFSELATGIVSDLYNAGFTKQADELQHLVKEALDQTLSRDSRKAVLSQIATRCDIKWLGDLYLPQLSRKDWWGKLETLGRLAMKHMKSI